LRDLGVIKKKKWKKWFGSEACAEEEKGCGQKGNDANVFRENGSFCLELRWRQENRKWLQIRRHSCKLLCVCFHNNSVCSLIFDSCMPRFDSVIWIHLCHLKIPHTSHLIPEHPFSSASTIISTCYHQQIQSSPQRLPNSYYVKDIIIFRFLSLQYIYIYIYILTMFLVFMD